MKLYAALLKAGAEPVLVPDGFCWGALFLGPLWLLARRAFAAAAISLAGFVLIRALAPQPAGLVLGTAEALVLGLFGNDLRSGALEGRGYLLSHVVAARGREDAWLRLLACRPDLEARLRPEAARCGPAA